MSLVWVLGKKTGHGMPLGKIIYILISAVDTLTAVIFKCENRWQASFLDVMPCHSLILMITFRPFHQLWNRNSDVIKPRWPYSGYIISINRWRFNMYSCLFYFFGHRMFWCILGSRWKHNNSMLNIRSKSTAASCRVYAYLGVSR